MLCIEEQAFRTLSRPLDVAWPLRTLWLFAFSAKNMIDYTDVAEAASRVATRIETLCVDHPSLARAVTHGGARPARVTVRCDHESFALDEVLGSARSHVRHLTIESNSDGVDEFLEALQIDFGQWELQSLTLVLRMMRLEVNWTTRSARLLCLQPNEDYNAAVQSVVELLGARWAQVIDEWTVGMVRLSKTDAKAETAFWSHLDPWLQTCKTLKTNATLIPSSLQARMVPVDTWHAAHTSHERLDTVLLGTDVEPDRRLVEEKLGRIVGYCLFFGSDPEIQPGCGRVTCVRGGLVEKLGWRDMPLLSDIQNVVHRELFNGDWQDCRAEFTVTELVRLPVARCHYLVTVRIACSRHSLGCGTPYRPEF